MILDRNKIASARWWLLAVLIAFAPFHAFLATWLKIPGLSVWREAFVLLIIALIFVEFFSARPSTRLKLYALDWFILALLLPSFFWLLMELLSEKDRAVAAWALGFRYDVLPWIFLFFLRRVEWAFPEKLIKIFFGSAAVVLIFGLAHALVLPKDFLTHFGYSNYQGEFVTALGVPACQFLEHTGRFCRAISTFGGPTRYGTYLLLVVGMLIYRGMGNGKWKMENVHIKWQMVLVFLGLINILLTFSRSIWIGLFAMGSFAFYFKLVLRSEPAKPDSSLGLAAPLCGARRLFSMFATTIALLFVGFLGLQIFGSTGEQEKNWPPPILKTIFVRESSTDAHAALLKKGLRVAAENPLGIGLGKVGPASVRYGEKFLTENWYLQIAIEMGWLGLLIFLGMLAAISRELLQTGKTGLFLALLGISVAALFTHAFEETTTVLLFAALAGTIPERYTRHP